MEQKKFKQYTLLLTIIIGFIIGLSAITEEFIIGIVAIVIGMIVLYVLKNRVKQAIEDERTYRISEKASRRTIQVVGSITGLLGFALIILSKKGYLELTEVGISLAFFASILLILYMMFYAYYSRKLGE